MRKIYISLLIFFFLFSITTGYSENQQVDSSELLKQLKEMKTQMQKMQESYEKRIQSLEKRIEQMEGDEELTAEEPTEEETTEQEPIDEELELEAAEFEEALAEEFEGEGTESDIPPLGTFSLSGLAPRPAGVQRMNPDIGVVIDTLGRWSEEDFPGDEDANRWRLREGEMIFTGYVDPFAKLNMTVTGHEDEIEIEEAYATIFELPLNTQIRVGKYLLPYGILNKYHTHDLPQVDRPLVLQEFFGEHLADEGVEASWLIPNPWDIYSELKFSYSNGDEVGEIEAPLFSTDPVIQSRLIHDDILAARIANNQFLERDWFDENLLIARWANFFELSDHASLLVGLNGGSGVNRDNEDTGVMFGGFDAKFKYTWADQRKFTAQFEQIWWDEEMRFYTIDPGDVITALDTDINPYGGYIYGEYEFIPKRWAVGTRFDWVGHRANFDPRLTDDDDMTFAESVYLTFMVSDFQRWCLQYRHTDYDFGSFEEENHELMLQASFILGFHPAHKF